MWVLKFDHGHNSVGLIADTSHTCPTEDRLCTGDAYTDFYNDAAAYGVLRELFNSYNSELQQRPTCSTFSVQFWSAFVADKPCVLQVHSAAKFVDVFISRF